MKQNPKLVLATLNAKFIHSSLALRYLAQACQPVTRNVAIQEYHINMPLMDILSNIYAAAPEIVGFSCYIWNITPTLQLAAMLKQILPDCLIILGGPEVSYDAGQVLAENPTVDYIIAGEAEAALPQLIKYLVQKQQLTDIPGLAWRNAKQIHTSAPAIVNDLAQLPMPYQGIGMQNLDNKLVYLESSRGCPFACAYCLSSQLKGVRYFPLEVIKDQCLKLLAAGHSKIKFVDRTFNCHKERAMGLWRFLKDLPQGQFHFEIAADLLDEEMLTFLASVPAGKFQFEIGIQTTTPEALTLIERKQSWDKLAHAVKTLAQNDNISLHLDLIAGLPGDTFPSFATALNHTFTLKPTRIQLGFLKLLKGTKLRHCAQELGLIYQSNPPYEILTTPTLPYQELVKLKQIEALLEVYYNSNRFNLTLELIVKNCYAGQASTFFQALADFWQEQQLFQVSQNKLALYDLFAQFITTRHASAAQTLLEALLFDFLCWEPRRALPAWIDPQGRELKNDRQTYYQILSDPKWRQLYLPHLKELSNKELDQNIRIVKLVLPPKTEAEWYLFDYTQIQPLTGRARVTSFTLPIGT